MTSRRQETLNMTDPYVVQLELDAMPTPGLLQSLIEHLDDFQTAVSTSSAGLVSLTLTVPAADLRLAVATGLALARVAAPTLSVLTVSAMPERVRKDRQGLDAGELLSASQAAEIL